MTDTRQEIFQIGKKLQTYLQLHHFRFGLGRCRALIFQKQEPLFRAGSSGGDVRHGVIAGSGAYDRLVRRVGYYLDLPE